MTFFFEKTSKITKRFISPFCSWPLDADWRLGHVMFDTGLRKDLKYPNFKANESSRSHKEDGA